MTLSVIIVNYNVKFFLEQCLHSLRKSVCSAAVEVIVVDNHSTDDSVVYLQQRFPEVIFLQSPVNLGFGKACNKGLERATGEYILFLNPDTLVAEDTLEICLRFLAQHADAGALGVRMIDGSGHFLKESKRAFPSPLTSLFKLFGLARLFPHSRVFSRYHLGHLDAHQDHEVDVLAGAFMLLPKRVLEKVGAFDEAFFMYGEDVDLSYRVQKGGYKNYYLARTEIIHFKGESTKRGSLNYVRMFYSAMSTFVKKHYGGSQAVLFNAAIHFAIWLRAGIAAVAKFIRWIGLPVLDAGLILLSFWLVKGVWTTVVKPHFQYPNLLLQIAFPAFTGIYLLVAYYAGLYDKQYKPTHLIRTTVTATVVLLALYALLPEQYRFSRGIVVFGALLALVLISLLRRLLVSAGVLQRVVQNGGRPYLLLAGTKEEVKEVKGLLKEKSLHTKVIGHLAVQEDRSAASLAPLQEVNEVAPALNARELVLVCGRLSYQYIISFIQKVKGPLRLRFHAAGSHSIVGSDSSGSTGETLSTEKAFNLARPSLRRQKRLVDLCFSLLFLLTFPLHLFVVKHPLHFLFNALLVLVGRKTWIGYATTGKSLPPLRRAVLASNGGCAKATVQPATEALSLIDYWYAQNYEPLQDVKLILKNYRAPGC